MKEAGPDAEVLRTEMATAGTLGALEYVLRGIETLPGRKSVLFVSEGFDLELRDAKMSRRWAAFTRVMDRANRAGVVVYTVDPRGLADGRPAGRRRRAEQPDRRCRGRTPRPVLSSAR